jgi:GT2 family glycosyltransferase
MMAMTIFAVIVVYRMSAADSPTLTTLLASAATLHDDIKLTILVWDNTPGGQTPDELPASIRYHSAPDNPGLSMAYNWALDLAFKEGYEWLLTLDQDSILPIDFLSTMARVASQSGTSSNIGAIVPLVLAGERDISPFRFYLNAIPYWYSSKFNQSSKAVTYAINSAALLRVSSLKVIGGYNPLFPLDISDIEMFHRLHKSGASVHPVETLRVTHDFSILDKSRLMSLERYKAQLFDECAFWDMQMSGFARMERIVRLIGRALKDCRSRQSSAYLQITLLELKRRLLTRRSDRVRTWLNMANQRAGRVTPGHPAKIAATLDGEAC